MAWQVLCLSHIYNAYLLPSPFTILSTFIEIIGNGTLLMNVWMSMQRVIIGYCIALVLAMALSIISMKCSSLMEYFNWILQFLRYIPPLGLIPLLILWVGIGENSKLIIIILASFFPMYLNIEKGFKSTDIKLLEVGQSLGFSNYKSFWKITVPFAIPDILVGMRVGLGYSFRGIIGAEMVAASSGLGYMINFAKSMSQTNVVIAGIITIGILGYCMDIIFKYLIKKIVKDMRGYGWD